MHYGEYAFRDKEWGGYLTPATKTIYLSPLSMSAVKMQKEEQGRGVKMGQWIGLSYCDELKIRKFYSEPGIEGGKKCKLWTSRTCNCRDFKGHVPDLYDE